MGHLRCYEGLDLEEISVKFGENISKLIKKYFDNLKI